MATPAPLVLTPEIRGFVTGALDSGNVLVLAVVDRDGKPILSFRGSTAVYSEDQLCLWVRNTTGGTIEAIRNNPHVAMMYRSPAVPMLQFNGRARIADDEAERERVFSLAHEREQQSDPKRTGNAIIIDLDAVSGVIGFNDKGPIFCSMAR
ncbi:MAG TPA: pyridoxamine 5'-phosphate oxidase family protein [Stellaceae bacterium]|nr:pyridoxamine 5'-phosphate oxidase family protein [Stellaceae bacterium]